jgi:hypothetical protein
MSLWDKFEFLLPLKNRDGAYDAVDYLIKAGP